MYLNNHFLFLLNLKEMAHAQMVSASSISRLQNRAMIKYGGKRESDKKYPL